MKVFITGGSSGLGLELAKRFLNDGHTVAVCAVESEQEIHHLIPEKLKYFEADVCDTEQMKKVMHNFAAQAGGLDIAVANAGISMPKAKIPDFSLGRKLIEINVLGTLNTFEPAIEIMKQQRSGQLVAMGSIAGTVGLPGTAIYGASKSAVINLCESLEIDLHHFGIQVTTLAPGFIDTPLTKNNRHKMPFLLSQEKAVDLIYNAILKKRGFYIIPWQMRIISRILYHLPRGFYKWFMKADYLGLAKE
jgi:NAD(P)-dependent dehydrogenase (short-subunit alcohol dehydrogenase family)